MSGNNIVNRPMPIQDNRMFQDPPHWQRRNYGQVPRLGRVNVVTGIKNAMSF